jgi:hypothetical protein
MVYNFFDYNVTKKMDKSQGNRIEEKLENEKTERLSTFFCILVVDV